jgi:hypothetical protein
MLVIFVLLVTLSHASGASLTFGATSNVVPVGSQITVVWSGLASPSSSDWIGLFNQADAACATPLATFVNTAATASGTANVSAPLFGGLFVARYFAGPSCSSVLAQTPTTSLGLVCPTTPGATKSAIQHIGKFCLSFPAFPKKVVTKQIKKFWSSTRTPLLTLCLDGTAQRQLAPSQAVTWEQVAAKLPLRAHVF